MRMMMTVSMGLEAGNRAAKDGRIGKLMAQTTEKIKPEAAYFTSIHGKRTALFFFDLSDTSQIPMIAEVLFQELDAEVEFSPVMNAEDLKKGLTAAGIK